MRKTFLHVFVPAALFILPPMIIGCTDKKTQDPELADSDTVVVDTTKADSLDSIISEAPMPKTADELFDDFLFNFAANKRLQRRRVAFPLPVYENGKLQKRIGQKQWKMEHFFMRQGYYTLIFDNQRQMKLMKDTAVSHVVIEKIFLDHKKVKQYLFDRKNGQWKLTSINFRPMVENTNASFLKFYERFSTDSLFQIESMNESVSFSAPDPDDDFSYINGEISPEQWPSFKPGLIPAGMIYNIIYGQTYKESDKKIFVIRGISNGLETELTFKKIDGEWKLMQFNY